MFDDALHFLVQGQEAPDWARLGQHLPYEWIKQAVAYTGKARIMQHRLPAEQVVWLVVALAPYRHQSISEVVDDLDLALPDMRAPFVSKNAVAQARQCLGAEPLRALFEISEKAWSEQGRKQHLFKGSSLFVMDGTTLKVADTPEHREHFGEQVYPSGRISSYPQVRGVTLTAVPTHFTRDAKFGPYGVSEMLYAKELIASIPHDSLTVFDKDFLSAEILCGVTNGGGATDISSFRPRPTPSGKSSAAHRTMPSSRCAYRPRHATSVRICLKRGACAPSRSSTRARASTYR